MKHKQIMSLFVIERRTDIAQPPFVPHDRQLGWVQLHIKVRSIIPAHGHTASRGGDLYLGA